MLRVRSFPCWHSSEVNRMFCKIEIYNKAGNSPARRQQLKIKSREEDSSCQLSYEISWAGLPDFAIDNIDYIIGSRGISTRVLSVLKQAP